MTTTQADLITVLTEELYEINHETYAQDLSQHIGERIQSGLKQIRSG